MAYQRPFLISLKRDSPDPWGFRTFGGKEYGEPHIVEKVCPDSIAEQCGIREGDEIIQIGRVNIQDCTFGQVQELLARSGNKIEMFVVREDLLSPRKGKEPSHVKAIVHNPYNSPLNLYSTENIAETLAKQTEVLTEGHVSSAEEEDAPENLSFKQKSAVFQLLEEQAKQETVNPNFSRQRKAPPPPPKAPPSATQYYQNKENYSPYDQVYDPTQSQQQAIYSQKDSEQYFKKSPTEYKRQEQKVSSYTTQSQKNVSFATTNNYQSEKHQTSENKSSYKVTPATQSAAATSVAHQQQYSGVHQQPESQRINYHQHIEKQKAQQDYQQHWQPYSQRQTNQQQQLQSQNKHQQYQSQQSQQNQYQTQHQQRSQFQQPQQQQYRPQQTQQQRSQSQQEQKQQQMYRQQHQQIQQPKTEINDVCQPSGYKSPPTQKHRVNWPPSNSAQQNGRWQSPSPTPPSPSKTIVAAAWPPKQPTVKDLPKTGFNLAAIKDQGAGRRCVWPPPKPDDELRSGRTTPQSPVTGRRIAWNPSPSPPLTRRSPFGSASPVTRRKDIVWPPSQPGVHKVEHTNQRPSPTLARKARFDDYVKQHASMNVPSTYRPPPGTQRVEYA